MRNHEAGASVKEGFQTSLHLQLRLRINVAGRLVKHDDFGVGKDKTRKAEKLTFPSRQIIAFGNLRLVTLGQTGNKAVRTSRPRRRNTFFVRGLGARKTNVLDRKSVV